MTCPQEVQNKAAVNVQRLRRGQVKAGLPLITLRVICVH